MPLKNCEHLDTEKMNPNLKHMHIYEIECIPLAASRTDGRSAAVYSCVRFNLEWTEPLYLDYRVYVGSSNKPNHYIASIENETVRNQHHRW